MFIVRLSHITVRHSTIFNEYFFLIPAFTNTQSTMKDTLCEVCVSSKFYRQQYGIDFCSKCKNAYYTSWLKVCHLFISKSEFPKNSPPDIELLSSELSFFIDQVKTCKQTKKFEKLQISIVRIETSSCDQVKMGEFCKGWCPPCRFRKTLDVCTKNMKFNTKQNGDHEVIDVPGTVTTILF